MKGGVSKRTMTPMGTVGRKQTMSLQDAKELLEQMERKSQSERLGGTSPIKEVDEDGSNSGSDDDDDDGGKKGKKGGKKGTPEKDSIADLALRASKKKMIMYVFDYNGLETTLLTSSIFVLLAGMIFQSSAYEEDDLQHQLLVFITAGIIIVSTTGVVCLLGFELFRSVRYANFMLKIRAAQMNLYRLEALGTTNELGQDDIDTEPVSKNSYDFRRLLDLYHSKMKQLNLRTPSSGARASEGRNSPEEPGELRSSSGGFLGAASGMLRTVSETLSGSLPKALHRRNNSDSGGAAAHAGAAGYRRQQGGESGAGGGNPSLKASLKDSQGHYLNTFNGFEVFPDRDGLQGGQQAQTVNPMGATGSVHVRAKLDKQQGRARKKEGGGHKRVPSSDESMDIFPDRPSAFAGEMPKGRSFKAPPGEGVASALAQEAPPVASAEAEAPNPRKKERRVTLSSGSRKQSTAFQSTI